VSGEVGLLDSNGETRRLILALGALVSSVSPAHFALIGGLAVMARLGQAHRGTEDIDTAVDQVGTIPSHLDVVLDPAASNAEKRANRPVMVDSIEVGDTPALDLDAETYPRKSSNVLSCYRIDGRSTLRLSSRSAVSGTKHPTPSSRAGWRRRQPRWP
jgi:hypothetical protein